MYRTLSIIFIITLLTGCGAFPRSIDLDSSGASRAYKCLAPIDYVVLRRPWNTCPTFSSTPKLAHLNKKWAVVPITSDGHYQTVQRAKNNAHKLDAGIKNCQVPTRVNEIVDLSPDARIRVETMSALSDTIGPRLYFSGTATIAGSEYEVYFDGYPPTSDSSPIGFDIKEYFKPCEDK